MHTHTHAHTGICHIAWFLSFFVLFLFFLSFYHRLIVVCWQGRAYPDSLHTFCSVLSKLEFFITVYAFGSFSLATLWYSVDWRNARLWSTFPSNSSSNSSDRIFKMKLLFYALKRIYHLLPAFAHVFVVLLTSAFWWEGSKYRHFKKIYQRMQPSPVACFSEDLKCWEAWDITRGYKAKDITLSVAWRREALKEEALDDLHWTDERGSSSVGRTLEPFQRQTLGKLLREGVERTWNFPSA